MQLFTGKANSLAFVQQFFDEVGGFRGRAIDATAVCSKPFDEFLIGHVSFPFQFPTMVEHCSMVQQVGLSSNEPNRHNLH